MTAPGKRELFNEETFKAGDRVGYSPEAIMRWFLRFLRTDLDALSTGDFLNLQYEVRFVSIYGSPTTSRQPFEGFPLIRSASFANLKDELTSMRFLADWQKQNVKAVDNLADRGKSVVLHFYLPPMTIKVLDFDTPEGVRWHRVMEAADPGGPLTMVISYLYALFAHRMHRCPDCGKVFMADRNNQDYCTNVCQNRAGTKRYRLAHGLITGKKRGRPPTAQGSREEETKRKRKT